MYLNDRELGQVPPVDPTTALISAGVQVASAAVAAKTSKREPVAPARPSGPRAAGQEEGMVRSEATGMPTWGWIAMGVGGVAVLGTVTYLILGRKRTA